MIHAAPWWGESLVNGSFLVAGLLVGALLTYVADHFRFKREDKVARTERLLDITGKIAATYYTGTGILMRYPMEFLVEVAEAKDLVTDVHAMIAQLYIHEGKSELYSAARDYGSCLTDRLMFGTSEMPEERKKNLIKALDGSREKFMEVAHRRFGIPSIEKEYPTTSGCSLGAA